MKKILVLRFDALGDTLVTYPLLETLKNSGSDVFICVVGSPRGVDALECCPFVDETKVCLIDDKDAVARLTSELAKQRFDAAIIVTEKVQAYKIAWRAKVPVRIGFRPGKLQPVKDLLCRFWLTKSFRDEHAPSDATSLHEVQRQLKLAELLALNPVAKPYQIFFSQEDERFAQTFLDSKKTIAVHFSQKWFFDGWSEEHLRSLILAVNRRYESTYQIILTYGEGDKDQALQFLNTLPENSPKGFCDPSFGRWAAVLSRCSALITMDTSASHVAAGLQLPCVVVFSSRYYAHTHSRWHPWMSPYRAVKRDLLTSSSTNANAEQFVRNLLESFEDLVSCKTN